MSSTTTRNPDGRADTTRRGLLAIAGAGTAVGLLARSTQPAVANPTAAVELVGDGTTDNGPLIQAAYDAGQQVRFPDTQGKYLIDTPVFFDEGVIMPTFEIDGGGAELVAGSNLPTSPSFGAGTTAFMFYPNTLRTALSGGEVTVSNATRATGSTGCFTAFVLRNVDVTGQLPDYGISFDNRCGVIHENITMTGGRVGSTWFSYAEPHVYREIYFRTQGSSNGQVEDAFYVHGTQEGDGVYVQAMKCSGAVGGVSLTMCRGAVIDANITTKLRFTNCEGITINGLHQEADSYAGYSPNVEVISSTVTFNGGVLYRPKISTDVGAVTILDDHPERASQVDFHGTLFTTLVRQTPADPALGAHVYVDGVSNDGGFSSTRVRGFGVKNKLASFGSSNAGIWRPTAGLDVRSAVAGVDGAVTSAAGLSQLASGDFDLHHGTEGWVVDAPGVQGLQLVRELPDPGPLEADPSGQPTGALANGTTYQYAAAFRDAAGAYTGATTPVAATPTTGAVRLLLQGGAAPAVVCLWRSSTGDVTNAADAYIELTFSDARSYVMDTGTTLNGMAWQTSDIPGVAARNKTKTRLLVGGRKA